MLELNTSHEKDVLVIELEGALDSISAADFRRYFQDKVAAGYRAFALDCLCLEYISSAGIAAIIDLQTQLEAVKGKMVLYQLSTEIRQLLRFLKMEEKLHIVVEYDEAISALTGYRRLVPEADMVKPEELHLVEDKQAHRLPAQQSANGVHSAIEQQTSVAATAPTQHDDEMLVEEQPTEDKNVRHAVQTQTALEPASTAGEVNPDTAQPAEPARASTTLSTVPEAQELKFNTGTKRLISCPNCKSILRVAVAGDYLCPACRFRFVFKPNS